LTSLSTSKLESQSRACREVLELILWETLVARHPADRVLAHHFRTHRHLGSRDRRILSEAVFATLRWWGWLRCLAPDFPRRTDRPDVRGAAPELAADTAARILLGAHLLEELPLPPVAEIWTRLTGVRPAGIKPAGAYPDLSARGAAALALLGLAHEDGRQPDIAVLVPPWAPDEILQTHPLPELIEWLQRRPPVWLRAQGPDSAELPRELEAVGIMVQPSPYDQRALRVSAPRTNLRTLSSYRSGRFEIQDHASQAVGLVCAPAPGQRWWDACAGAGGKALHLAECMQRTGTVVATDRREHALAELRRRARRAGFPNIQCRAWTGAPLRPSRATFHGVLVDAPCTCSGTWRRNPDARWSLDRKDINALAAVQLRLLQSAATGVRSGGVLVYATCSMFQRENREVVRDFLGTRTDFSLEPFPHPFRHEMTDGTLQIWPWDADCDAMFVARLRRD